VEEIVTGEAVVLDLPSARVPSRMLAHFVDLLVQAVVMFFVLIAAGIANAAGGDATSGAVAIAGFVLVVVGYPVLFETMTRGRTPGKMAVGLRVVSDDGGPVRFRHALVRSLAGAIECWSLAGVPAVIMSMFSTRGKRLGDVFAGTFVLRERTQPSPPVPWGPPLDAALSSWVRSLDMSALPGNLAAAAASYLARYWELRDPAREELAQRLASGIAARVSPRPPLALAPVAYLSIVVSERRARELARLAPAGWQPPPEAWRPAPPSGAGNPMPPPAEGHPAPPPTAGQGALPPPE
jgi:uncharacterized RDD family membrane protein YckC